MAIYHFSLKSLKNGSGRNAVQKASYTIEQKLYNERLGLSFNEKKHQGEVVFRELSLPEGISYSTEELFNFCESEISAEKQNWAKWGDFALPKEWTREEGIEHAREFINETFVKKGYAVAWAYHHQDNNDHIDYIATPRAFKSQGVFKPNEKKVYANCLKDGKPAYDPNLPTDAEYRIPEIDKKTGLQKIGPKNRKMWVRVKIENDGISSRSFLKQARKNWQDVANKYLSPENKIDCRSYKEQGIDKIPGQHISPAAYAIQKKHEADPEKNPEGSWKYEQNEEIKTQNKVNELEKEKDIAETELFEIKIAINNLINTLKRMLVSIRKPKAPEKPIEPLENQLWYKQYQKTHKGKTPLKTPQNKQKDNDDITH